MWPQLKIIGKLRKALWSILLTLLLRYMGICMSTIRNAKAPRSDVVPSKSSVYKYRQKWFIQWRVMALAFWLDLSYLCGHILIEIWMYGGQCQGVWKTVCNGHGCQTVLVYNPSIAHSTAILQPRTSITLTQASICKNLHCFLIRTLHVSYCVFKS